MTVIAITGTGAVCSAGTGIAALWSHMESARPNMSEVTDPLAKMPVRVMYAVPHRPVTGGPTDEGAATLGLLAVREALSAAHRAPGFPPRGRIGLVVGTAMGESTAHERRRSGVEPDAPGSKRPVYSIAGIIAAAVGVGGPAVSVSNACSASAYAIGLAREMLTSGECDLVIAVGAEAYSRVALGSFNRLRAVDAKGCRPFAADRAGTAFGEGAAALVMERSADADKRGATVLAELIGASFSSDAGHPTAPDPDGVQAARIFTAALAEAGVAAATIGAVVPHGTGTELNDAVEARLLETALLAATAVPLYSLKALIGHTGGAAGALGAVVAVEIARRGTVPGNVDVGELDSSLQVTLDRSARPIEGPVATNSYAFGGNNATLIFGRAS